MTALNIDGKGLKAVIASVSILLAIAALAVLSTISSPVDRPVPTTAAPSTVLEHEPLGRRPPP